MRMCLVQMKMGMVTMMTRRCLVTGTKRSSRKGGSPSPILVENVGNAGTFVACAHPHLSPNHHIHTAFVCVCVCVCVCV